MHYKNLIVQKGIITLIKHFFELAKLISSYSYVLSDIREVLYNFGSMIWRYRYIKICNKMGKYLCIDIAGVQHEVFETCCHELFPLAQNKISFS